MVTVIISYTVNGSLFVVWTLADTLLSCLDKCIELPSGEPPGNFVQIVPGTRFSRNPGVPSYPAYTHPTHPLTPLTHARHLTYRSGTIEALYRCSNIIQDTSAVTFSILLNMLAIPISIKKVKGTYLRWSVADFLP